MCVDNCDEMMIGHLTRVMSVQKAEKTDKNRIVGDL